MDHLVNAILLWLSLTFELPLVSDPPKVRYLAPLEIAAIRHGGPRVGNSEDVVAVYHDELRTVFLPRDWDRRNPVDISVLVHELVHHLQNVGSVQHLCPAEREVIAYAAQQHWLGLFGENLETAFGIDAMTLKLRTTCLY